MSKAKYRETNEQQKIKEEIKPLKFRILNKKNKNYNCCHILEPLILRAVTKKDTDIKCFH